MKSTVTELAAMTPMPESARPKPKQAAQPELAAPRAQPIRQELQTFAQSAGAFRLTVGLVLFAALAWAFWPTLVQLVKRWVSDPQYSHGYLVPGFALVLLWLRREKLSQVTPRLSWGGVALLAAALALYLAGIGFYFDTLAQVALLPALTGICVVLGGWRVLAWAWPAIAFLAFMLPLPFRLEVMLSHPLRRICTVASTYILQTIGLPAVADGNVIILDDLHIGVVEACSGLSMLVVFFAIATAVVLLIRRPLLDKVLLLASAAPIAIVANVIRITVTGLLYKFAGKQLADAFFHDFAGWFMMPLAVGILWLELWFLSGLLIEASPDAPKPASMVKPAVFPGLSKKPDKKVVKKGPRKPPMP